MKKIISVSLLALSMCALAYTNEDTSNANYLADQGIVTKQTTATGYRLDDKILRQEVIGMALKVKGITLPENYTCKKYFADATKNDWVCRAVELAADNGIITRSNKYANPGKSITRAEALAMVMKAGGIETNTYSGGPYPFTDISINSWQYNLIGTAFKSGIVSESSCDRSQSARTCVGISYGSFYPNNYALRSEVFGFAKNIIGNSTQIENSVLGIIFKTPAGYSIYSNEYGNLSINTAQEINIRKISDSYIGVGSLNISFLEHDGKEEFSKIAQVLYDMNDVVGDLKNISIQNISGFEFNIQETFTYNLGGRVLETKTGKVILVQKDTDILLFIIDGVDINLEKIVREIEFIK